MSAKSIAKDLPLRIVDWGATRHLWRGRWVDVFSVSCRETAAPAVLIHSASRAKQQSPRPWTSLSKNIKAQIVTALSTCTMSLSLLADPFFNTDLLSPYSSTMPWATGTTPGALGTRELEVRQTSWPALITAAAHVEVAHACLYLGSLLTAFAV